MTLAHRESLYKSIQQIRSLQNDFIPTEKEYSFQPKQAPERVKF